MVGPESKQVWESLTGKTKMAEYNMAEFKMAAIIKLSQNEQVKFFLCTIAESKMAEYKMAAIIKLSQNEWVKFFLQMVGSEVWVKCFLFKWWEPI